MIWWDESHLLREWEVEIEDTTVRAITRLIVNISIRANAPPRMPPVHLLKLLIHMGRYEKWQLTRVCHKEAQKAQNYLFELFVVGFFFVLFVPFLWLGFIGGFLWGEPEGS